MSFITGLNFEEVESQIKDLIKSSSDFKDISDDFLATSPLTLNIKLASGLADMVNYRLENFVKNSFLETTIDKQMTYLHSYSYKYNPKRREMPKGLCKIVLDKSYDEDIYLPKYSKLKTSTPYILNESVIIPKGKTESDPVEILQAEIFTETFTAKGENFERFLISGNYDIAQDIYIKINGEDIEVVSYYSFINSNVLMARSFYDGSVEIISGDGNLLKKLNFNDTVEVTYFKTLGAEGNYSSIDNELGMIDIEDKQGKVYLISPIIGGTQEDDVDKIKKIAPLWRITNETAVRNIDFEIITESYSNEYKGVVSQKAYNKCCVVYLGILKVVDNVAVKLDDTEKSNVSEYLDKFKMNSVLVEYVDLIPVEYDISLKIVLNDEAVPSIIQNKIENYFRENYHNKIKTTFNTTIILSDIMKLDENIEVVYFKNLVYKRNGNYHNFDKLKSNETLKTGDVVYEQNYFYKLAREGVEYNSNSSNVKGCFQYVNGLICLDYTETYYDEEANQYKNIWEKCYPNEVVTEVTNINEAIFNTKTFEYIKFNSVDLEFEKI